MNGNSFFADTNAILYILKGNPCVKEYLQSDLVFSIITEMELLGFPQISQTESVSINNFLDTCQFCNITNDIKNKTIELKRKYNIKLPDAIIAASSICKEIPLLSADVIFNRITELDFVLLKP